jgi:hypothetical protein
MSAAEKIVEKEEERPRLLAEVFSEGVSLGSYLTEGEDRLIIGSSKRADLVVPHSGISNIHAMLRLAGKEILLYDLGSEQGTYVQGKKIVERKLQPGEFFEIGSHSVKVNLLADQNEDTERSLFWKSQSGNADFMEMLRLENNTVQDERTLARNGKILIGRRKNEILLMGTKDGEAFIRRRDSGSHSVDFLIPHGYIGEIYDSENNLLRVIEQEESRASFNEKEKLRLISPDQKKEILLFWRSKGIRNSRWMSDPDSPLLQRAFIVCATLAALLLTINHLMIAKPEVIEEATTPKSSYFRLSMDSAPAAAPALSEGSQSNESQQAVSAPSKAASISSTLSKMLNKKSSLTAETIQQAISTNGSQTVRSTNLKNGNIQSTEIAAGAVGGGSVNVNAISAGLSSGSGTSAGSLKGFANGKGSAIGGTGSGFGGKGFDMSLGGDEAEAIGGLDKALIAAVVQANLGQIKHCYEKQLIVDPNIFGKVVAGWTINKDGLVSTSSVKKTTMNNKTVENCIIGKIKNWNFPKPKGGGQVLVSYPFLFKSLN